MPEPNDLLAPVVRPSRPLLARPLVYVAFVAGCALVGVLLLFAIMYLRSVWVPTGAMANTILPNERLVVTGPPDVLRRGDVVVFRYPLDPRTRYVKRIVGLPGDRILVRDRVVLVNGRPLPEVVVQSSYPDDTAEPLPERSVTGSGPYRVYYTSDPPPDLPGFHVSESPGAKYGVDAEYTVPERAYFVLGDNRDNSEDSRYWGPVPAANIVAMPRFVLWSASNADADRGAIRWSRLFKRIR